MNTEPARFEIHELVRVESSDLRKAAVNGRVGDIEFRRCFEEHGWYYRVRISAEHGSPEFPYGKLWDFTEYELRSMGQMSKAYWLEQQYPARFADYEKVKVISADPAKINIHNEIGCIRGRSQDGEGNWHYGVFIYRDELVYGAEERELAATGEFDSEENHVSGITIRVKVDESGEGEITGVEDETIFSGSDDA